MNSLKHNSTSDQPTNAAGSAANGAAATHRDPGLADGNEPGFVRFLVHELRNMLAPIRNAAHIVRLRGADDANLRTVADLMERQINGIGRLLNSLSEAERVRRGELSLEMAPVDVVSIVKDAVRANQALLDNSGQRLRVSLPAAPIEVLADAARLTQVISSVVENAAKHSQKGAEIRLDMVPAGNGVELRVRDSGRGMSADLLDRVFDFYAVSARPEQGGLGVSLPIARCLMELHGGRIRADSAGPGQGTEVTLVLPVADAERAPVVPRNQAVEASQPVADTTNPSQAGRARRILIADDNAAVRVSLAALLQDLGHVVKAAADGEAALEEAERWLPEFVFLDVNMPRLGGVEVARRLRSRFSSSAMKLVMMSGAGLDEPTRRGAKRAGFDHCIDKIGDPKLFAELLQDDPPPANSGST